MWSGMILRLLVAVSVSFCRQKNVYCADNSYTCRELLVPFDSIWALIEDRGSKLAIQVGKHEDSCTERPVRFIIHAYNRLPSREITTIRIPSDRIAGFTHFLRVPSLGLVIACFSKSATILSGNNVVTAPRTPISIRIIRYGTTYSDLIFSTNLHVRERSRNAVFRSPIIQNRRRCRVTT
jgi:hypothetical protein